MADKEANKINISSEETAKSISSVPEGATPAFTPADTQAQQLAELARAAESLRDAVYAMQAQAARNAEFRDTIDSLKEAAKAITLASTTGTITTGAISAERSVEASMIESDCSESPCDCVSAQCCCFDIVMSSVRVLGMQPLEIEDSNANPWGELEVKMFAYLNSGTGVTTGAVIPGMFSRLSLSKLIQWPGLKVRIDRTIGTVCLRKGKTKTIIVGVDAIEEDSGLIERATGGRDEEGSNSSIMVLDCCCSVPPTVVFDISFTSGGQGGGAIEVEFMAVKRC